MQLSEREKFTRKETIEGVKQFIAFLEANPEFDLPESLTELWVRTLVRQNAGELKTLDEIRAWFVKQVSLLKPDRVISDEHFTALRHFGGGVQVSVYVAAGEVCSREVEIRQVTPKPIEVEEATWHCPPEIITLGFAPDQDKMRERESSLGQFLRQGRKE
jgi:hypothetical protein